MDPDDATLVDRIVFTKTTPSTLAANLYVLEPGASAPVQLTFFAENVENRFFAFTRGGWAIYQHGSAIMAVPIQGASPATTITLADAALSAAPVAVSSDDRVVFQVANGLRSVRVDGSELKTLATTVVAFHGLTTDDRVIFSDLHVLYAIPAGAGAPSEAIEIDESANASYRHEVVVAGQFVVFAKADVLGTVDLSVAPPNRVPIASGGLFEAPTLRGAAIFYNWRVDVSHELDLWVIQRDGSGKLQLTDDVNPIERFRGVTTDGRVIYERTGSGDELFSVKLDGSGRIQIAATPASFAALAAGDHAVYQDGGISGPIHSVRADGSNARLLGNGEIAATTEAGYVIIKSGSSSTQSTSVSVVSGEAVKLENVFQNQAGVTSNGRLILGGLPAGGGVQLYSVSPSGGSRSWLPTSKPEAPGGFDTLVRVVP